MIFKHNVYGKTTKHTLGAKSDQRQIKPANTSTKILDYILRSLLGYPATELRNGGVTNSSEAAKPGYICSETVVRLGICVFPTDQSNFYDTGGKIFKTSVNKLRQTGDHFLALI